MSSSTNSRIDPDFGRRFLDDDERRSERRERERERERERDRERERERTRAASRRTSRLNIAMSLMILLPLYFFLPYWASREHFRLPTPKTELYDIDTGLPQLSEEAILAHAKYLSEDIGFRTVGTREHALGDKYVFEQAKLIQAACEDALKMAPTRKLECEVWRQEGSGSHRFDMMGKPVFKIYKDLSNIILRISDGTPRGKQHALLLNAHVDSTIPSPGASDDALSVGILLEIARVFVSTPDWQPNHAIVFLFNNAEESLQDGSHLFATQHPARHTVRAVINLEAAGNTGPEILFQATSEEMIQAYSKVPYPFATVLANDVFQSGIILSDTDFRQFQEYQNLTGLDMAVVGDSYTYHTRKDLVQYIEPGVAQHFAENVFAITHYLTSAPDSSLPHLSTYVTAPTSIYFSLLGRYFFLYTAETAWRILAVITVATVSVMYATGIQNEGRLLGQAAVGVIGSLFGAIFGAAFVASIMTKILNSGMSWFAHEFWPFILYGPPALAGALTSHYFFTSRTSSANSVRAEYATFVATHLFNLSAAIILQLFNLGSSSVFTVFSVGSLFALWLNTVLNGVESRQRRSRHIEWANIHLTAYFVAQFVPLVVGAEMSVGLLTIFVPLTGRLGEVAPVEHIIAIMTAVLGFLMTSFGLPIVHRVRRNDLLTIILGISAVTGVIMLLFTGVAPFDPMHQKRLFVLHYEDIVKNERHLHIAAADGAPGLDNLVHNIAQEFTEVLHQPVPLTMDDYNADWNIIYPFSQFLTPYKLMLPEPFGFTSPHRETFTVRAENDIYNHRTNTRSVTLVIDHPGVIWTVIAFDANVLKWSLESPPVVGYTRHHIKEASFYGVNQWRLDLLIAGSPNKVHPEREKLQIDFMGIVEQGSWPGKIHDNDESPAMGLFASLDGFLKEHTQDSVDAMLISCVGGQVMV